MFFYYVFAEFEKLFEFFRARLIYVNTVSIWLKYGNYLSKDVNFMYLIYFTSIQNIDSSVNAHHQFILSLKFPHHVIK